MYTVLIEVVVVNILAFYMYKGRKVLELWSYAKSYKRGTDLGAVIG